MQHNYIIKHDVNKKFKIKTWKTNCKKPNNLISVCFITKDFVERLDTINENINH